MPHHFLYLKNAYHILIIKPSLPRLYLYHIQKISAHGARYFPKISAHNHQLRSTPKSAKIYPSELVGLNGVPVMHSR